ncbi:MAG: hypothetical protein L0Z62_12540 [Gemmataceae bacterium]|nr:hypothetical protein [Gemmataceae bacterium]
MQLSDRELATVLAALRFWQDEMGPHAHAGGCYPEHFEGTQPLDSREIDELCERLNVTREVPHGP